MKIKQRRYRDMLRKAKIEAVSNLVLECGKDMKKLHKAIIGITSNHPINLMPDTTDGKHLAEDFAKFFMGKSRKDIKH